MDIFHWLNQTKTFGISAISQASDAVGEGLGFVKTTLGGAWLYGSTESSSSYDHKKVDEKHYFLVPDRRAELGYSLYSMRCLPEGVPPINDLPKQRLFHLPNEHALPTVEQIILASARENAEQENPSSNSVGARLNDIADQIDRIDSKLFHGVLLIGGLVALINPLAGAAIALKAMVPSIGLFLSKYGLKYAGDLAHSRDVSQRIKNAEMDVLKQFKGSGTDSIVNPLLSQLDRALETSETKYDPILQFDRESLLFGKYDRDRLFQLTCQAISNTYEDVINDPKSWSKSQLGPEDIRFLKVLRELAKPVDD